MEKGKVSEIFLSVQGEGPYAGACQLFCRLYGCQLGCRFCDTKPDHFEKYLPQELYGIIKGMKAHFAHVSFTGGEPLLQIDFLSMVLGLLRHDAIKTHLETNGVLHDQLAQVIDLVDIISMDIKLPSSTGLPGFWAQHQKFLSIARKKDVYIKSVISADTNKSDLVKAIDLISAQDKDIIFILQPDSYYVGRKLTKKLLEYQQIALNSLSDVRVMPQMHKILQLR